MLHFAPESEFQRKFKKIRSLSYISADLFNNNAMLKMDIKNIQFPDESIDIVYCSHVLEHVEDDRKAIAEIYRVLKKGGRAVISVPITAEKTFEDPSITDPHDREKEFGQKDHVRRYGIDVVDRLQECCFRVRTVYTSDLLSVEQTKKMGLSFLDEKKTPIFLCCKQ